MYLYTFIYVITQMMAAVAEDAATGTEVARNDALSRALIDIAHVSRVSSFLIQRC